MSTLNDKLNLIKDARDDIQTALAEKGQVVGKDIRDYAEAVANIDSGSGDVKLFDTVEHMQQDENPQEGDLAVVYREEIQAITEESDFDSCTFPNTVVLEEAFSDNVYGRFISTGSSYFDGMVNISSSMFRFNGYGDTMVRVQYTSSDGITYTRTDGGDELQEFGTTIQWDDGMGSFNSVVGNFMKIGGNYFEGIYNYELNKDYGNVTTYMMNNDVYSSSPDDLYWTKSNVMLNRQKVLDIIFKDENKSLIAPYIDLDSSYGNNMFLGDGIHIIDNNTADVYIGVSSVSDPNTINSVTLVNINGNRRCIEYKCNNASYPSATTVSITVIKIRVNMQNNTISITDMSNTYDDVYTYTSYGTKYWHFVWEYDYRNVPITTVGYRPHLSNDEKYGIDGDWLSFTYVNGDNFTSDNQISPDILRLEYGNCYKNCSTQLDTTSDYVYEKTFYGKNGIETGTLGTSTSSNFADSLSKLYVNAQNLYDNMTPLVATNSDKRAGLGTDIVIIPTKTDGTPLLDTSNVTTAQNMFMNCTNLTSIPLLNTSNVTSMISMFYNCKNLTSIPLLDTSNVTNMETAFSNCTNLTSIPLLDTGNVTSMNGTFSYCDILTNVPLLNTSNVTNMNSMFGYCTNLTSIPLLDTSNVIATQSTFYDCKNLTSIPLLNTSNVIYMVQMFSGCSSLVDVPQLNTSKVTDMHLIFSRCTSLSDTSLNNILAMCKNTSTSYTDNKTLNRIGLTSEQATRCQSLSNYQDFINAGWTTGY